MSFCELWCYCSPNSPLVISRAIDSPAEFVCSTKPSRFRAAFSLRGFKWVLSVLLYRFARIGDILFSSRKSQTISRSMRLQPIACCSPAPVHLSSVCRIHRPFRLLGSFHIDVGSRSGIAFHSLESIVAQCTSFRAARAESAGAKSPRAQSACSEPTGTWSADADSSADQSAGVQSARSEPTGT